jgi:hypothetical protein
MIFSLSPFIVLESTLGFLYSLSIERRTESREAREWSLVILDRWLFELLYHICSFIKVLELKILIPI